MCHEMVSIPKEYDLKQHFETKHILTKLKTNLKQPVYKKINKNRIKFG